MPYMCTEDVDLEETVGSLLRLIKTLIVSVFYKRWVNNEQSIAVSVASIPWLCFAGPRCPPYSGTALALTSYSFCHI